MINATQYTAYTPFTGIPSRSKRIIQMLVRIPQCSKAIVRFEKAIHSKIKRRRLCSDALSGCGSNLLCHKKLLKIDSKLYLARQ